MSTISIPGIGSGLDITSIVTGLVDSEQVPYEARITLQEEVATEKITSLGSLVSAATAFQDAAEALSDPDLFEVNTVSSTSSSFSVSVDSEAVPGNFSVEVQSVAQGQKLASQAYDEDGVVGAGTMTIAVNGVNMNLTFEGTETISDMKDMINDAANNPGLTASIVTDDDGQHLILNSKEVGLDNAIQITVADDDGDNTDASGLSAFVFTKDTRDDSGATAQLGSFSDPTDLVGDDVLDFTVNDNVMGFIVDTTGKTLEEVRDEINSKSAAVSAHTGEPVTASIVTDSDGNYQLHLDAGTGNAVSVTATDSDGNDIDDSVFAFDPTTDAATKGSVIGPGTSNMSETQAATDAVIVIDGYLTVTQSSNVFENAIEGVTITATSVDDAGDSGTITIAQDTSAVGSALANFAAAYNTFLETSISLGRVNVDSNIVGSLVGESILRTLNSQVRNILSETIDGGSGVNSLASLGLTTNREGLLEVDETILASQVNGNFEDVRNLFIGDAGIMNNLTESLSGYTGGDGVIQAKIDSYKTTLDRLSIDREEFTEKMTALEERLYTQFNAMDLLVAQLNSTGDYLTSALDNLPGVVSNNN